MRKIYTIRELPKSYFGREYTIFSFDVLNETVPLALTIGTSTEDITIIRDLDKLGGYGDCDVFIEDIHSYNLFVDFLKSIFLREFYFYVPMRPDIEYVKKHFYIDMKLL